MLNHSETVINEIVDKLNSYCQFRDTSTFIKWTPDRVINGYYCFSGLYEGGVYILCSVCHRTMIDNVKKILDSKFEKLCAYCKEQIKGSYRHHMHEISIKGYIKMQTEHCLECSQILKFQEL